MIDAISMRRKYFGPYRSLLVSNGPRGDHLRGPWSVAHSGLASRFSQMDPMMLVQLPNGEDNLHADVGVYLHYHYIRGSNLLLLMPLCQFCSAFLDPPPSPDVAYAEMRIPSSRRW
jgi:hypothetical protein